MQRPSSVGSPREHREIRERRRLESHRQSDCVSTKSCAQASRAWMISVLGHSMPPSRPDFAKRSINGNTGKRGWIVLEIAIHRLRVA